jgi:hypothetical protein
MRTPYFGSHDFYRVTMNFMERRVFPSNAHAVETDAETCGQIEVTESENESVVKITVSLPPPWPEHTVAGIAQFWSQRRVVFSKVTDEVMVGERGSLFWNAVSFDMGKLRSSLQINLDGNEGFIHCRLRVNTTYQNITQTERMYWVEEMRAFQSFLKFGDERKDEWVQFQKELGKSQIWFVVRVLAITALLGIGAGAAKFLIKWLLG